MCIKACNEVISDKVGKRDIKTGAASGALTGGFYAGLVGRFSFAGLTYKDTFVLY
jgi:hypothetical protein